MTSDPLFESLAREVRGVPEGVLAHGDRILDLSLGIDFRLRFAVHDAQRCVMDGLEMLRESPPGTDQYAMACLVIFNARDCLSQADVVLRAVDERSPRAAVSAVIQMMELLEEAKLILDPDRQAGSKSREGGKNKPNRARQAEHRARCAQWARRYLKMKAAGEIASQREAAELLAGSSTSSETIRAGIRKALRHGWISKEASETGV